MKQSLFLSIILGIVVLGFLVLFISIKSINLIMFGIAIFTMCFSVGQSYFEDEKLARLKEEKNYQLQNKTRLEKELQSKNKALKKYTEIVINTENILKNSDRIINKNKIFEGSDEYFSNIGVNMKEIHAHYYDLLTSGKDSGTNLEKIVYDLEEYIDFTNNRIDKINREILEIEKKELDGEAWIKCSIPISILACIAAVLYKLHFNLMANLTNALTLFTLALTIFSIIERKK